MSAIEVINLYVTFLWEQFQYDWSVLSNPWVLYTGIPVVLYTIFMLCKWYLLLIPITLPISLFGSPGTGQVLLTKPTDKKDEDKPKSHFQQLLKG